MALVDLQLVFTFALVAAAIGGYASERVPMEVTSLALVAAILLFFHAFPILGPAGQNLLPIETVLAGFASPAMVAIMSLLVIGQGLYQTAAFNRPLGRLLGVAARAPRLTTAVALLLAGGVSAFMNNTPVVVMFIPIMTALAMRMQVSASRLLLPMNFITILGGTLTLVGSSTNLLVDGVASAAGARPLGFFEPFMPGVFLVLAGAAYVILVLPRILPERATMAQSVAGSGGKQFIAQIDVQAGHPLEGAVSRAGLYAELKDMTVRLIQRGEHAFLPPFEDVMLAPGDVVIVAATREALTGALAGPRPMMAAVDAHEADETTEPGRDLVLAEAVVAPGSRLIGRSIEQAHLRSDIGVIVLGVQRRSRMIRVAMGEIRLEAGDVILVLGRAGAMRELRASRDVLLLEWSQSELPKAHLGQRAAAIFIATLAVAASGLLPIALAALIGALAMIPSGCLNVRQAARAFDRRIYMIVGASFAIASPIQATGAAALVAETAIGALEGAGAGPGVILSAVFLIVALFTNVLSNHATAAIFTPIALSAAHQVGIDPTVLVLTVIYAANCSFATPMGYQTNLLVMGPGHYRFIDFLRAGTPLVLLNWAVYSLVVPWYFAL
jgi:di/tricarboxylate transporter